MNYLGPVVAAVLLAACGALPIARTVPTPTIVPTPAPSAARGKVLFRDKGCITCHTNSRVGGETGFVNIGPNLSQYHNDATFLTRWLSNPPAVRPGTQMPNLQLAGDEIQDLIAFLNETQ